MSGAKPRRRLPAKQRDALLAALRERFERNPARHAGLAWEAVQERLEANPAKLWSLQEMEASGGEPDVTGRDAATGRYVFCDCAAQSPKERESLCYDREAREARKKFPPKGSATERAEEMGVELLTEEQYLELQRLGEFDTRTSSWLRTPAAVRKLGGAIFGDRRFGRVFIYHNGAESYYSGRGFRACLRV